MFTKNSVIIMAQQQHAADVHPDELCPPNKRYDLMDANKKVDLGAMKMHILASLKNDGSSIDSVYADKKELTEDIKQSWKAVPAWMITEEMKAHRALLMYTEVFRDRCSSDSSHRLSQNPEEPHRTKPIAPRRSACLTPPALVPNVDKADEMILRDTLQVSLAEHKSREEQEARENVHCGLTSTWHLKEMIEPRSDKESPDVEIAKEKEVEISKEKEMELTKEMEVEITQETPVVNITNVVIPVNVNDENEEIIDEVYELKTREKGKIIEETRNSPTYPIRSPRIIQI
ncbi:hypothetical protein Tco_0558332 [Tanacetum coccineum]